MILPQILGFSLHNNKGWETNDYDGGYENWLDAINPYENDFDYEAWNFSAFQMFKWRIIILRLKISLKWRNFRWNKLGLVYSNEVDQFKRWSA